MSTLVTKEMTKDELEKRLRKGMSLDEQTIQNVLRGNSLNTNDLLNVRGQLERQGIYEDQDFYWR